MAHKVSSVKDFLDHHHRRSSLFSVDPTDITNATIAENGDTILTVRVSESHQEEETVDISQFAPQDIERLRVQDPFLYYSIQNTRRNQSCCDCDFNWGTRGQAVASAGVARAERDVADYFDFNVDIVSVVSRRTSMPDLATSSSNPQQRRRHSTVATANNVKRQRRFSAEVHPSLVFDSVFAELNSSEPDINLGNIEEKELVSNH